MFVGIWQWLQITACRIQPSTITREQYERYCAFLARRRICPCASPLRHAETGKEAPACIDSGPANADRSSLQRLGGWASLAMVEHYAQMVDEDLLQAHKANSPVDSLGR